jgi:hypothetical protein
MPTSLNEMIAKCIAQARTEQNGRENSLVITKLQEAMMWQSEAERVMLEVARRSGVGMTQREGATHSLPPGV